MITSQKNFIPIKHCRAQVVVLTMANAFFYRWIIKAVCKFKRKNVERVEEIETNMQVFSVKNKNKNVEKNLTKEKKTLY